MVTRTAMEIRDSLQKKNMRIKNTCKPKASGPLEKEIQAMVEQYLTIRHIEYLRIPNGVYQMCAMGSSADQAQRNQVSSYLKSWPDLMIFKKEYVNNVPTVDNSALFIELKRKGGRLSQGQRAFQKRLTVHTCYSVEEAIEVIEAWL